MDIREEKYVSGYPNKDKLPCITCAARLKGEEGYLKCKCSAYPLKPASVLIYAKKCPYYVEGEP